MFDGLVLQSLVDGRLWEIEDVRSDGIIKISFPRTELEEVLEEYSGPRWGYCTSEAFRGMFGIKPIDILSGWL
jgi:hypothetical protein